MDEKVLSKFRPKYGIKPDGEPSGVIYQWAFDTLEEAKANALELSRNQNVTVLIFKIIGVYYQETSWVDYE